MVVIGILAAIAIPHYYNTRGRAYTAAMKTDLHNVAVAEEGYYYQHGSYAADLSQLSVSASPGVTLTIASADSVGWAGTADHPGAAEPHCAIFYGQLASPPAPATAEGTIACQ